MGALADPELQKGRPNLLGVSVTDVLRWRGTRVHNQNGWGNIAGLAPGSVTGWAC